MVSSSPCEMIGSQLSSLFSCEAEGSVIRIRTPFLYPDGAVIDLFAREDADGTGWSISDLSETTRWLRQLTLSPRRSSKQTGILLDIATSLRVEFFRGMFLARVNDVSLFADAVMRLGQAVVRAADLIFTYRIRAADDLREDVADFLTQVAIPFERNTPYPGRSGRIWTVDFHTRTDQVSALMMVLSTGNMARAHQIVEHSVATFYDLSHLRDTRTKFISLIDDSSYVWKEEHLNLLGEISTPIMWSESSTLQNTLMPVN